MGGGGGKGGKSTEELFTVDVSTVRLLPNNRLYHALVYQAIEKTNIATYEPPMTITGLGKAGFYSLQTYYNWSKWSAPYSFPTCSLNTVEIPEDQIEGILQTEYGATELQDFFTTWRVETDEIWYKYRLQEIYDYEVESAFIYLSGTWFYIAGHTSAYPTITVNLEEVISVTTSVYKDTTVQVFTLGEEELVRTTIDNITEIRDDVRDNTIKLDSVQESQVDEYRPLGTTEESYLRETISTETVTQTATVPVITTPTAPMNYAYSSRFRIDGRLYYWVYYPLLGTNTNIGQVNIPALGVPVASSEPIELYPMTVLRHNHFSIDEYDIPNTKVIPAGDDVYHATRTDSITKEKYDDTEWVLRGLGLSIEDLLKTINENPDVNKIADAILCMAVEPTDTHHIVSKVLFESFKEFNKATGGVTTGTGSWLDSISRGQEKILTITRDPFNMGVQWSAIYETIENKVIGDRGFYRHKFDASALPVPVEPTCSLERPEYWVGPWEPDPDCQAQWAKYRSDLQIYESSQGIETLVIEYQATDTITETMLVFGLKASTIIGRWIQETSHDQATSDAFVLPIPTVVVNRLSFVEQIELLERSLRLVFYASQYYVTELAWYETGFFQIALGALVFVISIVISYFTGPVGMTWGMAIMQAIQGLVIAMAVSLVISAISSVVDIPYFKQILGVIKIAVAIYAGFIDLSSTLDLLVTAVDLLNIGMSVILGEINLDTLDIQKERQAFRDTYEDKSDYLNEMYKEMNEGMQTEDIVALANSEVIHLIPPSTYYETVFNTMYDYDLLFNNSYDSVSEFYSNSFSLD